MSKSPVSAEKNLVSFGIKLKPGSKVFVAGTFNDWSATANPLKENSSKGHYVATLKVCPGKHEYKFVVNDLWLVDPSCPVRVLNSFGTENNVVLVEKPDAK